MSRACASLLLLHWIWSHTTLELYLNVLYYTYLWHRNDIIMPVTESTNSNKSYWHWNPYYFALQMTLMCKFWHSLYRNRFLFAQKSIDQMRAIRFRRCALKRLKKLYDPAPPQWHSHVCVRFHFQLNRAKKAVINWKLHIFL